MASRSVTIGGPAPKVARKLRSPSHSWHLRTRPFQIQPFMIAPVIPGETLKNALLQARAVSSPVKNPFIGWWNEYYLFYVKHRDLDARDALTAMMLDPDLDASSLNAAGNKLWAYVRTGEVDFVEPCLKRVVEEYFRDEGEAWDTWKIGDLPAASINSQSWMQSAINRADLPEDDGVVTTGTESSEELERSRIMWELMRAHALTEMTYEDYLRTHGVRIPKADELHKPELIRYVRDWTYPTNTVNPATGVPSTALSWSHAERIDKDRFFKEPGFIFGVTVARPKVYLSKQHSNAVSMLNNAFTWLPAILRDEVYTSLKEFAAGTGPLETNTTDYVVDVRDLLLYGDQFINFALTETDAGMVALPTAAMQKRYVSSADVDALFSAASPANQVKQDGVIALSILGAQTDNTP